MAEGNRAPDHGDKNGNGSPAGKTGGSVSGYDERLAHFIRLLSDDNEGSRWKAAEALGRMGDPVAVKPLIDLLWDDDPRVRKKAVWALGRIGDPEAIPALRRLYRMENETVREFIEEALGAIRQATGERQA